MPYKSEDLVNTRRWRLFAGAVLLRLACGAAAAMPGDDQAYTGTLDSPPVPLTKAGGVYVQPYLYLGAPTGVFNAAGDEHPVENAETSASSLTIVKYGLTHWLSIYTTPEVSYGWGPAGTTSGPRLNDLPVILQGYVLDRQGRTWHTSVTLDLGMDFPTGAYDRLSRGQNGTGSGAYAFRYGLIDQTAFKFQGLPPFRARLWVLNGQPLATAPLHGLSVYGTHAGFSGHVAPEAFGSAGGAIELALDRHVVLGLDVIRDWSSGSRVSGRYAGQNSGTTFNTAAGNDWFFVPAVEYNFSSTLGLVGGVGVTGHGHDATQQIVGTAALAMTF
jgi:hypothetical protein